MWFCRHIIPTVSVLLTFGLGYANRKFFLTAVQKRLLKEAMTDGPHILRQIFETQDGQRVRTLAILCAIKPLLTPEEMHQLPACSKALDQKYPGVKEVCTALSKPAGKSIMDFLAIPTHGKMDYVQRLNQLEAALAAYGWVQVDPKLAHQSLIKEFRTLIS
jgi:hypothetical protein